ncbi:hypothetical protein COBT_004027, partial [Conglomerata obtusa]
MIVRKRKQPILNFCLKKKRNFELNTTDEVINNHAIYKVDYVIVLTAYFKDLRLTYCRIRDKLFFILCKNEEVIFTKETLLQISMLLISKLIYVSTFNGEFFIFDYELNQLSLIHTEALHYGFVIKSKNIKTHNNENNKFFCEKNNINQKKTEIQGEDDLNHLIINNNKPRKCADKLNEQIMQPLSIDNKRVDKSELLLLFSSNGRIYALDETMILLMDIKECILSLKRIDKYKFYIKTDNNYVLKIIGRKD